MPKYNKDFLIVKLKDVIEEFKNQKYDSSFIHCKKEYYNYFYLHKKNIVKVIPDLKTELKKLFQLNDFSGIQIIGDSAAFSVKAHQFLLDQFAELKKFEGLIFYGFTGEGANGIVADLIKKETTLAKKVMANIVANASLEVIEKYDCPHSKEIENFFIVDDDNGDCQFGDDINLSDALAAQLICLEGGVISFGQILNTLMLHKNPQITLYIGLRNEDNTGLERRLFSASELFLALKQAIQANCLENSEQFERILNHYLQQHRFTSRNNNEEELKKQKQIQAYFDQFKQLDEVTQDQIINKIKKIQIINYREKIFPENASQCNFVKDSTPFFLTYENVGSQSEDIQCKGLKIH